MSETPQTGVLYTEHSGLTAMTPVASLWSYETRDRERHSCSLALTADGSHEYWLDRSDPLLNTILPGTGVSLTINIGDMWAAGRSPATSALLPRMCVVGPVTRPRILRVGRSVRAFGAGFLPTLTPAVFGVPASELVDRMVPLEDLWARDDAERLFELLSCSGIRGGVSALKDALVAQIRRPGRPETVEHTALGLITRQAGRVSIHDLARSHGISRQQFSRRFCATAGLPPKLFARITRFQALVQVLLSADVSRWASASTAVGFYDQAHMINEFRAFAGSPPTVFFRPHGDEVDPARVELRGRPSEWLRPPRSVEQLEETVVVPEILEHDIRAARP